MTRIVHGVGNGCQRAAHRAWRRLRVWLRRRRNGHLRISLGTRLLVVMVLVASVSTAFCVLLQDQRLSADLRSASRDRVQRAAMITAQLLDDRLRTQVARYQALATSPQFLANVEADHRPTLTFFAEQLRPVHGAAAIVFLDADGDEVAGAGESSLRDAARQRLRRGPDGETSLAQYSSWIDHDDQLFAIVRIPIGRNGAQAGSLLCIEALAGRDVIAWSKLCGARVTVAVGHDGDAAMVPACTIGDLQVRVTIPSDAEDQALANSRDNLLAGGMLGLAVALAASLLLARHLVQPIRAIQRATERIGKGQLELRLDQGRNDEVGDVARSFNTMLDSLQRHMRERSHIENQASHLAFHDSLTGLPNRRLLKQQLATAVEVSQVSQSRLALLFLDLDRFKNVNDTLGHSAGDNLLLSVASRLRACIDAFAGKTVDGESVAMLARLGGDEFTLLLPDVTGRRQVAELADQIIATLSAPFEVAGHEVSVSTSVGIAMAPDDAVDVETLLRDADMAMFHAKGRGGSSFEFYADSMEEIAARRLALENKLRRALEVGELEVHYQPKLDLETDTVCGLEALLRWRTADGQSISPTEFIPIAEETGAILAIGEWVLRAAIAQILIWQQQGLPPLRIAVNVSARQIAARRDFVGMLRDLLAETGIDPSRLDLEITESSLLTDADDAVAMLAEVRALGVGLSLDDFGTGYSSLSYLRRLPIDTLKIDRSFIQGAADNPADVALVGSIVAMAKVLGLRVVVEGVETQKQRRFLEQLGCDEIQGFLVSPAVPAAMIPDLLQQKPRRGRREPAKRRSRATTAD